MARPRKVTEDAGTKPAETPVAKDATPAAKSRPIRKFQVDNVCAAVWARTIVYEQPVTFYSISFERIYEDAKGKEKYTGFFHMSDLAKVVSLCQQAEQYVIGLLHQEAAKKAEQAHPEPEQPSQ